LKADANVEPQRFWLEEPTIDDCTALDAVKRYIERVRAFIASPACW
jgi:hypothetical protein